MHVDIAKYCCIRLLVRWSETGQLDILDGHACHVDQID